MIGSTASKILLVITSSMLLIFAHTFHHTNNSKNTTKNPLKNRKLLAEEYRIL
jgi:hypothetical protein